MTLKADTNVAHAGAPRLGAPGSRSASAGVSRAGRRDPRDRVESVLTRALQRADGPGAPPRLMQAYVHSVFPGGARVRPLLTLAVAAACGDPSPALSDASAAAIELLHCASLVHDDLPCFDDADVRRGRPSVHAAFGERLAVLAGDGLIVLAFQVLAECDTASPQRIAPLLSVLARRAGAPTGITAGQAWECEPCVSLPAYHRAKTGSLFVACTEMGAMAAGADPAAWRGLGLSLGEAYQVADDIRDVVADAATLGKPPGQDVALLRPSSATELGLRGAVEHFDALVASAIASIPVCAGAPSLRALVQAEAERLVPRDTVRSAALAAAA
ncbi:MAG: polyprenyl synthetase family protein [Rubrivivax sp.]|jgi:geranylgeranyl diphosphate synthase type II